MYRTLDRFNSRADNFKFYVTCYKAKNLLNLYYRKWRGFFRSDDSTRSHDLGKRSGSRFVLLLKFISINEYHRKFLDG